ncbi:MAG TPA: phenylalanine--tRNA ligase subunit beta [Candidatus Saccharimonadales bacterium]|nr:phenylalanine--tRNA ligase subunit beta [Candidatus Saccharimonadales bacterium]
MKISTGAVKFINEHYHSAGNPARDGADALVQKIGAQLAAVEETDVFGKRYDGIIIVKIISSEQHPNADRLHVCKVDDGGKLQTIDRDEEGHVQVVCGAPNVRVGMLAAWIPPGATVPSTYDKEPFVVGSRDLRGVMSHGMMASPKELALGDSHEGLLDIDEGSGPIAPGTYFVDAFHMRDDVIIDMENKMFTHRPDLFGWLGIARELEGIQHRPYKSPNWYIQDPEFPDTETDRLPLEVHNEITDVVPRFTAVVLSNIELKPSPVWLQIDLVRAGLRPINNIVDYTNYYMLLTGQPLHAYDYDKVKNISGGDVAVLTVRRARATETLALLNGKEITLREEDMVVVAGTEHIAGLGGAMGGADTEVDKHTKHIILEAATWDMYTIRRTAMAHGVFTDAVTRFNKGQSPLQNKAVMAKIVDQIRRYAGGKIASPLVDINHVPSEAVSRGNIHAPVTLTRSFINDRLGWNLSVDEISQLLTNVEFSVTAHSDAITVAAPFWRTDIEIPEDVVEEVGRLYGFDHLPMVLPKRDLAPAPTEPMLELQTTLRGTLAAAGANEVLTYSFVHGELLDKAGQDRAQAFKLSNALSPDLQYFRMSLAPSLLNLVHTNVKAGYDSFALFEIGKAHIKGLEVDGLPAELERLAVVCTADGKAANAYSGAAYYQARQYLMRLLKVVGLDSKVTFEPVTEGYTDSAAAYYQPGRAAVVRVGDTTIGRIGEYKSSVRRALKLPNFTAGFELGLTPLLLHADIDHKYTRLPRFPKVEQDICLKVNADMPYGQVYAFVSEHLDQHRPDKTYHSLSPVDIYQREDDQAHKQITLRLSIASYERTLTDKEVTELLDRIAGAAKDALDAERV